MARFTYQRHIHLRLSLSFSIVHRDETITKASLPTVFLIMNMEDQLAQQLARHPQIKLGILFGSVRRQQARSDSDLDLAVAADRPLDTSEKMTLIEELTQLTSRPVDLIDLQLAGGLLLQEILTKGKRIYNTDSDLHAELIKEMLFNEADFMPYRDRMLKARRKAWIDA